MKYDLVILDPHVSVGQSLDRFKWLNKMIRESPDEIANIICVGDYASMDSLSSHSQPGSKTDRGKPTLQEEFDAIKESQEILFNKCPVPRKNRHMAKGNHEHRFNKWAENNPITGSCISFDVLSGFTEHWGKVREYGSYLSIRGVDYTHVPFNGMGRPISGVGRARTVALQASASTVFGHSHNMQFASVGLIGPNNRLRCALSGPAFQEQDTIPDYAKNTQSGWNYGVLKILPLGENKGFGFHWITMKELEYYYG